MKEYPYTVCELKKIRIILDQHNFFKPPAKAPFETNLKKILSNKFSINNKVN